jgi:hypothetical protein
MESRTVRAMASSYASAHEEPEKVFTQSKLRVIHESMDPRGIAFRESRDSEPHPKTVPIILGLDETGSMGSIPAELIANGLPTLMSTLIQRGVPDASLLFLGIGDHETDKAPLQVGQFESGDAELDMWLTRTYLEHNGGGNAGESYLLAWYFAAYHTRHDAWEKRQQKGFLFTVGDEPCLQSLPMNAVKEIMGTNAQGQATYTAEDLLRAAQKHYNVFHIHVQHNGRTPHPWYTEHLGQNHIILSDYRELAIKLADIVTSHVALAPAPKQEETQEAPAPSEEPAKPQDPKIKF